MKAYTDLEQSKKLAEILPPDSADMYYYTINGDWEWYETPNVIERRDDLDEHTIPCWSLAALLEVLPETIEDEWGEYNLKIDMIYKKPQYVILGDCSHSDFPSWDWNNEELLDNIVEAVIWLNNKKLLNHDN